VARPARGLNGHRHRKSKRRGPRGHWLLVTVFCAAIGTCLLLDGYTHGVVGEAPGATAASVPGLAPPPASVLAGGPIVNTMANPPRSLSMPPRTIALTFDDGPDPRWTPQILAVLRRFGAHATFFEIGARAAEQGAIVRALLADGNEIGTHTYTHVDLGTAGWRRGPELTLTENALAGVAGIRTRLLRLPYSSEPDALNGVEWQAVREAGKDGYLVAFADHDTRDWSRPGVASIVAAAMPSAHRGEIVMMHDGGGNRSQTVAALTELLTRLRGRGYRFTTITGGLGMPSADVAATATQRTLGDALVLAQRVASDVMSALGVLLVAAAVLAVVRLVLLVGYARVHRRRWRRALAARHGAGLRPRRWYTGPVSIIVPAYNEAAGIAATVRSLHATRYPGALEIIVVDDGSADDTAAIARGLALPGVRVVSQPNAGKAAALNTGLALARYPIAVLIDGDTVFEEFTVARLVAPFADPAVAAVSGNTKVGNRRGILGRWQHIEYVIGFNLDRRMFDVLGCMPTVPGAIGAFRRQVVAAAGGVSGDTLAEDTDLTMAVCRAGHRVAYVEDAYAWTEAPGSLRQLWRQRYRWCYGTLQAMWKHKRAIAERGASGRFGRRCLIYLTVFQFALPLFAPVMDVFAVYGLLVLDPLRVAAVWLAFTGVQLLTAGYAFRLDNERLGPLWALPLQQVVYRQLLYFVGIHSVATALLGLRLRWRPVRRAGTFATSGRATRPIS
jgi:cellulose synthase/poly-beta-1,6-N-acetylglucosamine synthase-like glycosyltransferase/peptidoglycan/xylan/chitin deacetylase (PgdA/CDA1 family)